MRQRMFFLALMTALLCPFTLSARENLTEEAWLVQEYNVSEKVIQDLRKQGIGYGGIAKALSLARQMPGGISDKNLRIIMDKRKPPGGGPQEGWGKIARELGLELDDDASMSKQPQGKEKGRARQKPRPIVNP